MTSPLIFSRVTLRRTAEAAALSKLIDPIDPGRAMTAHHRLLWGLFGDGPDRRRDFLWRQDGPRRFYVLSHRRPVPSGLLECDSRPFAPDLAAGDRLTFLLRANATKSLSPRKATARGQRIDLVMNALPPSGPERTASRQDIAARVGAEWLERQGTAAGFSLLSEAFALRDYSARRIPREGAGPVRLGVLDMEGILEITDPDAFLERLARGFGRGRAFGCGLMMIRRAR